MTQGKVRALLLALSAIATALAAFGVIPHEWASETIWSAAISAALALPTPGQKAPPKDVWKGQ